jgi:hypothetical protein
MPGAEPLSYAAWRHREAREGFEVVFFTQTAKGYRVEGSTAALEPGGPWSVDYLVVLDGRWRTQSALISGWSTQGRHAVALQCDESGCWTVDGERAPHLDGCLDVDLESSALTNAFPANRLGLEVGEQAEAPAAYVRAVDLSVARLEQQYARLDDVDGQQRYRYAAPGFEFECELVYGAGGLVVDYPGIACRVA